MRKNSHERAELFEKLAILLIILILIIVGGIIGYKLSTGNTWTESVVLTFETLALVHRDSFIGWARTVEISLLFIGVIFVWFSLWAVMDMLLERRFRQYFMEGVIMRKVSKLKNHYVICGGGRVGMHLAEIFDKQKKSFVIVEKDAILVKEASRKGYLVYEGDALEEETLLDAGIKTAKAIIAVLPKTEENILTILTAKDVNPKLTVYGRADKQEYVKRLKKSGADHVFMPEYSCAEEIAETVSKQRR